MAIVRGLPRLDDPARFRIWAYRIVRNKCTDWTRRRILEDNADRDLRASTATQQPTTVETARSHTAAEVAQLRRALKRLPHEQRAVLGLHYLDGMGVTEIALTMEIPEGTVKSRLHHARHRLQDVIERTRP